ncbi:MULTISPECIES: hypothetical protein [unclassified Campylobacter]|uniref:hypothetical protein n=1 Tax=unclassified Campylobacter TaxID=2593542 RepID=UPI001472EDD3|nr:MULTISPECIES: hypothetical protein [unclassified Campylobacter]
MANISEFIVSIVELVEAQADDIRHSFFKSASGFLLTVTATVLAIIGFIFFLVGLNILLVSMIGEVAAYLSTSFVAFIAAFIIYKVASWKAR